MQQWQCAGLDSPKGAALASPLPQDTVPEATGPSGRINSAVFMLVCPAFLHLLVQQAGRWLRSEEDPCPVEPTSASVPRPRPNFLGTHLAYSHCMARALAWAESTHEGLILEHCS